MQIPYLCQAANIVFMAQVKEKKTSTQTSNGSNGLDITSYRHWYETMVRIRKFEERALKMYSVNKIRGFLHVYVGQEAIAGAITSALRPTDPIVTAYRQHGIALSRGISSKACMAELFGKETGVNKGKGGSMHFFSKDHHYFGGNGIVGAQIPIGTGIAFAEQYKGTDNLCLTMFGDGAARQGALYESFNMAMTWKLPVLYVCENNQYAMGTSVSRTSNVTDLYKLGLSFDMPSAQVDGMDVMKTHYAMAEAAAHIRSGKGPYLLEIKTYRYRGHSVSDPAKYRTPEELETYKEKDPIDHLREYILDHKLLSSSELESIDQAIIKEIDDAEAFAEHSAFPSAEELYTDNYLQEDYPFIKD
jgi:pyruvate dehydrogenase E1 component alpha subunit